MIDSGCNLNIVVIFMVFKNGDHAFFDVLFSKILYVSILDRISWIENVLIFKGCQNENEIIFLSIFKTDLCGRVKCGNFG